MKKSGMLNSLRIAFFGTPEFAVSLLRELEAGGLIPNLIATNPDEPSGRKLTVTPPPVKIWGLERNIRVIQPENLKSIPEELTAGFDLFIVAAYGKIIPESIINLPKYGTINVHPSLLPKYRGPSPVQAVILNGDKETGVSIMLLDKEMDHGPIIAKEIVNLDDHPYLSELKEKMAKIAGKLIIKTVPDWISGGIKALPQDHTKATFTKKIQKEEGFIESKYLLDGNIAAEKINQIERMVRALNPDPGVFTFFEVGGKKIRVKITRAKIENQKLVLEKVIPEGKREMGWEDFRRGHKI